VISYQLLNAQVARFLRYRVPKSVGAKGNFGYFSHCSSEQMVASIARYDFLLGLGGTTVEL